MVFIQISTDVSSALKIFETINERGVGLDSMDLLKNLLFTQVKDSSITRINAKLRAFEHWSAADIDDRQEMLIGLAKDVWTTTPIDAG